MTFSPGCRHCILESCPSRADSGLMTKRYHLQTLAAREHITSLHARAIPSFAIGLKSPLRFSEACTCKLAPSNILPSNCCSPCCLALQAAIPFSAKLHFRNGRRKAAQMAERYYPDGSKAPGQRSEASRKRGQGQLYTFRRVRTRLRRA